MLERAAQAVALHPDFGDEGRKIDNKSSAPEGTRRIRHVWVGRGFWAITDQGLFAGSNFLLNILLARWLDPREYGAFAAAFAVFLLLSTAYTSLMIEPMLVFGPSKYRDQFKEYLEALIHDHWLLTGVFFVVLIGLGMAVRGQRTGSTGMVLVALGAASPFVLLQWLMRRACYVRVNPRLSAVGGAGYSLLICIGACLLFVVGRLSAVSASGLMGFASLVVAVWLARRLGIGLLRKSTTSWIASIRKSHWVFGRWAIGAAALNWLRFDVFFLILPVLAGLGATGEFRALYNFLLPFRHLNMAVGPVILPALVTVRNTKAFSRRLKRASAAMVVGGVFYWAVLAVFHRPLVAMAYSEKYGQHSSILQWLGVSAVFMGVAAVCGSALGAIERPDRIFWANVASGVAAVASGLSLIPSYGVLGASAGVVVSSIAGAVVMARFVWPIATTAVASYPKGGSG